MSTFDLLKLIMQVEEGYTLEELLYYTKLKEKEIREFLDYLIQLEIIERVENNYKLANKNFHLGKIYLTAKKGWGVVGPDKEYHISNKDNLYKNGEYALFTIRENKKEPSANIKLSFKKENTSIGEVKRNGQKVFIIKRDETLIPLEGETKSLVDGSIVSYIKNGEVAEFLELLCHINDPDFMIKKVVKELKLPNEFNEEVKEEAKKLPLTVEEKDILGNRDLREEETFTIDGDTAKDFDDAISLQINEFGNFVLKVHIAHVSYYVKEGSAIDLEAQNRGTSVYMINKSIPMLPEALSYEICSLKPFVDRLTRTCEIEYDKEGNIIRYDIYPSVIRSKKRMTYTQVNNIFEGKEYHSSYEPFISTLQNMRTLAHLLRQKSLENGFINFERNTLEFNLEDDFTVESVYEQIRGESDKMIETFMLEANKVVAQHMYENKQNILYRVHEFPDVKSVNEALIALNIKPFDKYHRVDNKDIQNILSYLKNNESYQILSAVILQSFKKACYRPINSGHFGISAPFYTHFTSPIRRYPDTTVHRLLRTYLFKKDLSYDTIDFWERRIPFLTEHTSKKERDSIECEREVDDMKKAEYMMDHIGEEYTGMISGVMSFGMFVELENLVEGLIKVDTIKGDYYTFDSETFTLRGKKDKRGFRLGDVVRVKVVGANKEAKTVDFELIR